MIAARPVGSEGAFASFGLHKNILRAVTEAGFADPRPIQTETIPQVLAGRDVLGLAQTGTGKTAAFALPIIQRLAANRRPGPRALILAPTRELVMQISAEIRQLSRFSKLKAITIFGGVSPVPQVRGLRGHPDIIVACPGRLLDLMGSGDVRLGGIEVLVLDEADQMFDMGFLPDIKRIIKRMPERRQNLLFSATMPGEIRRLTRDILDNPHVVELAVTMPLETIEHALFPIHQKGKTALLEHLLGGRDFTSAIVFLRTRHRAKRLAVALERAGHRAVGLQGNMSQAQRQRAMKGFRDGRYDVLVATDIAARGIDVAKVSHVINYDMPGTPDAYTHRIGRTGRGEDSGKAFTFVTKEDQGAVRAIERKLNMEIPRARVPQLRAESGDGAAQRGGPSRGRPQRSKRPGRRGPGHRGRGRPKNTRGKGRRKATARR